MASFNEIIQKNKMVLVDFSAEWCGPCQTLAPILKELKEDLGDALSIIKIDVDKNQSIATEFRVQGVPTLMLYRGGQQVWRQSGLITKNELLKIVQAHE
ncbi:MAG: thioredoxin [Sphingobacteriaceae bacterium]